MKRGTLLVAIAAAFLIGSLAVSLAIADMDGMDMGDTGGSDTGALGQMGKHMTMSAHMTMTPVRAPTAEDSARAQQILQTMRAQLSKYQDYKAAEADGYKPYMESIPQDVYHFSNLQQTQAEYLGDIDLKHPGSLLYEKKTFGGYKLVGAMYSAPTDYKPEQLDKIIPLGLTHWHAHTNICLPAGISENDVMNGRVMPSHPTAASMGKGLRNDPRLGYYADARFGFNGTIANAAECESAGGSFHQQIFGWMVHVYPFAGSDDTNVAFGMDAP
jgi:hypothetical protein